jgi:hypothetical protein
MATIYMPLLNDGTDVWRPVEVTPLQSALYRVEGEMPSNEEWEFAPGTIVQCEWKKFSDGEHRLIAAGVAPTVGSEFRDQYKRIAGIITGFLPFFAAMEWLRRGSEGTPEPLPQLLVGAGLGLGALAGMVWLKPRHLTLKWTLWSGLGFGLLFCLMSLTM